MMFYAALTFWLFVIVLTARGVHQLWSGMVKPKALNIVLLPGTLVAQVAHVLGLLVTGATVRETTLFNSDEAGAPRTTHGPNPKIPILGPVVIGMLPILACVAAIFFIARLLGAPVMTKLPTGIIGPSLPTTLPGIWQLLRDQITLVESLVSAVTAADFLSWKTWLFLYLLICLTVRIAPFPGNLRGALGAILILGVGAALTVSLLDVADLHLQSVWAVLNLTLATLLFLLLFSLLIRGTIGLTRVLGRKT